MENKPSFDRDLIWPILLGGLSLIGIGTVFVFGRLSDAREPTLAADTETPFRFVYLGTEPGLSTLTPESTATPEPTTTELTPPLITLAPATEAEDNPPPTGLPTRTFTPSPTIASVLRKVDDTYFEILYDGDWVAQSGVNDVYENTLHISSTVGNSASYTFTGQQVIVSFQSGPSLGSIIITLDGLQFEVSQSGAATQLVNWQSAILVRGTHTIVIEHFSGGSVNLDSITIPDVATPTPSPATPATLTPTSLNN
ncbi:MAG TPA: hypothetical protein VK851_02260 [Anaerolineales bacterium]|nr:hypothetical protein [Anaerolineales bacterium]